jgi:hypothetical protein
MANRLIRVRHMSMPEGLDAFTWRISEDHVVLYANTLIGHFARVKASRMALRAANVRRRYLVMLWPIMLWAALRHSYKAHSSAANTVGVGAGVLGVIVAVALLLLSGTSKTPTHAGTPPIAVGNPSPSTAPAHSAKRRHKTPAPSKLTPVNAGATPTTKPSPVVAVMPAPVPSPKPSPKPTPPSPPPIPPPTPKASCHTLVNSHGSKQVACNGKARGIVRRHGLTPPPWSHGRKHHHKHHG